MITDGPEEYNFERLRHSHKMVFHIWYMQKINHSTSVIKLHMEPKIQESETARMKKIIPLLPISYVRYIWFVMTSIWIDSQLHGHGYRVEIPQLQKTITNLWSNKVNFNIGLSGYGIKVLHSFMKQPFSRSNPNHSIPSETLRLHTISSYPQWKCLKRNSITNLKQTKKKGIIIVS